MLKEFFALIYPQYCLACKESIEGAEETICTKCRFDLPMTNFHLVMENKLEQRFRGKINLTYALSFLYFIKKGKVQELIHNLKYRGYQEIGALLGKWYGYELAENNFKDKFDIIIPIPLHKSRLRKRGYNQCHTFSESLSLTLEVPYISDAVARVTSSVSQTRKSRFARWKNVEEIFVIKNPSAIQNKRILLVDDVVTTGATIEACGHVLLKEGASNLSVVCIAMAE